MSDTKPKFKLDTLIAEDLRLATIPKPPEKGKLEKSSLLMFPAGKPPRELVERIIERVKRI